MAELPAFAMVDLGLPTGPTIRTTSRKLQSFDLGGSVSLGRLIIEVLDVEIRDETVIFTVRVPDRDRGDPIQLTFSVDFDPGNTPEEYALRIRQACQHFVGHEFAELLLVHGLRQDPHAPPFRSVVSLDPYNPPDGARRIRRSTDG
jgi:hypothetical protein